MRVLVVDDSVTIRERIVAMLSRLRDVEVVGVFGTADDALEELDGLVPDLIILDLRLPGRSGVAALPEIRCRAEDASVVIYTNFPFGHYKKQCLESGAGFFLDKSKDVEELCRLVASLAQEGPS